MTLSRFPIPLSLRTGSNSKSSGGRNNQGCITVRHRGGGVRRAQRQVSWPTNFSQTSTQPLANADKVNQSQLLALTYDPRRRAPLALVATRKNKTAITQLTVATQGRRRGQRINTYHPDWLKKETQGLGQTTLSIGDRCPIGRVDVGDYVHSVSADGATSGKYARSAGTACQVRSVSNPTHKKGSNEGRVVLRLPSGVHLSVKKQNRASIGRVAHRPAAENPNPASTRGKAGRSRWLGIRPTVRGVARNPVDHPHGGSSRGRPSVSFRSWPTKGRRTRSPRRQSVHILLPRTSRQTKTK